jgi:hypothetical protein
LCAYGELKPDNQHCEHPQDNAKEDAARDDYSRHQKDADLHGVTVAAFLLSAHPLMRMPDITVLAAAKRPFDEHRLAVLMLRIFLLEAPGPTF